MATDEQNSTDEDRTSNQGMSSLLFYCKPADLTVSKRPGTSSRIEIHFAVFNRLYLLFCFIKRVEIW